MFGSSPTFVYMERGKHPQRETPSPLFEFQVNLQGRGSNVNHPLSRDEIYLDPGSALRFMFFPWLVSFGFLMAMIFGLCFANQWIFHWTHKLN